MAKYQVIIGRAEEIDLVGVALGVPAKIDTGAYRSAIHASDVRVVVVDGVKTLKFSVLGHKNAVIKRDLESTEFSEVEVTSSNGQSEERYEVKLRIKLANKVFKTSFSLSDRSKTLYPILVGRTALGGRYLVDSARTSIKVDSLLKNFGQRPGDFEEGMD